MSALLESGVQKGKGGVTSPGQAGNPSLGALFLMIRPLSSTTRALFLMIY